MALYDNKHVAVLGAGLSGAAAALLLRSEGATVTVLDSADEHALARSTVEKLRANGINVVSGAAAERDQTSYDLVVTSPGIDPKTPLAQNFSSRQIQITGELELGWRSSQVPAIAITGTNGKTTTTELVAQMLNDCGQRTVACGNIGKPVSEAARESSNYDVLTIEVSSFQLETISTFKPAVSVWLNFAPDHLDRYESVAAYRAAKLRIFDNQTAEDFAVVNAVERLPAIRAQRITFSAYADNADFVLSSGWIVHRKDAVLRLSDAKLRGAHNIENLMAALAVGRARGLAFEKMVPSLCAYDPRPHRCEFIRAVGGVDYINDSKGTNLDAVEKALLAQNSNVILIAGGKDKGFGFETLAPLVREKVRAAVLIGELSERIAQDWRGVVPTELATSLADAVERAHSIAQPGEVVLFSPGTSSFDMFKSYVDRGDQFRALVHALTESKS
jgi:UDP-N-acetylmuramoylalanine--D-glutamate ligase